MKTLRLSPDLEKRLRRAATIAGESLSEFIRHAAAQRADALLTSGTHEDFTDVIGVIQGGGGRARQTGKAFADIVSDRQLGR